MDPDLLTCRSVTEIKVSVSYMNLSCFYALLIEENIFCVISSQFQLQNYTCIHYMYITVYQIQY